MKITVVGAGAVVTKGTHIKSGCVYAGNPAKKIKEVTDEMIAWKTQGTALYQQLPEDMHLYHRPCEPLTEMPADRKTEYPEYATWNATKQ